MVAIPTTRQIGGYAPPKSLMERLKVSLLRVKMETADTIDDQTFETIDQVANAVNLEKLDDMGLFIDQHA